MRKLDLIQYKRALDFSYNFYRHKYRKGIKFPYFNYLSSVSNLIIENNGNTDEAIAALIHDIGDNLAPANHAEFAATILQPFVSEENYWIVKHHGIFQGYYFFEFLGLDKNMRDNFIDNPYYESCREFCEKYDQNSFDPDYDTLDLEFFLPMVKELFKKPKRSIYLQS